MNLYTGRVQLACCIGANWGQAGWEKGYGRLATSPTPDQGQADGGVYGRLASRPRPALPLIRVEGDHPGPGLPGKGAAGSWPASLTPTWGRRAIRASVHIKATSHSSSSGVLAFIYIDLLQNCFLHLNLLYNAILRAI